jgi:hypothetical protein
MSTLFLSCEVPKMLLLAGVDRLDRELIIGQMQGRSALSVVGGEGRGGEGKFGLMNYTLELSLLAALVYKYHQS